MLTLNNKAFNVSVIVIVFLILVLYFALSSSSIRAPLGNHTCPPAICICIPNPCPTLSPSNDSLQLLLKLRNITEKKVFSQNGEDGVLEDIFSVVGTRDKFYVEFGVEDGSECNTRNLFKNYGWNGVLMDGGGLPTHDSRVILKEYITTEGIVSLFQKYNVPKTFDLLSVDIDSYDYWVTKEIFKGGYRPVVLIAEINRNWRSDEAFTVPPDTPWVGDASFGCSAFGYHQLMKNFGYYPVYIEHNGVNIFFVQVELLAKVFNVDQPTMLLVLEAYIPFKTMVDPYIGLLRGTDNFVETTNNNYFCKIGDDGLVQDCCKGHLSTPYECKPALSFVKPKSP